MSKTETKEVDIAPTYLFNVETGELTETSLDEIESWLGITEVDTGGVEEVGDGE